MTELRDMIWSLTASYHTIQEGLDYDDHDHFFLRTGTDCSWYGFPTSELHLRTPATLLVNHQIYAEVSACLARQGVSIHGPPRLDAEPRKLESWELLCCVISPSTLRNVSKFSLDVSDCCWGGAFGTDVPTVCTTCGIATSLGSSSLWRSVTI